MGREKATAALCATLFLAGIARAETLRVPDQYATIQEALDAADPDDVVLVARRTEPYIENLKLRPGVILEGEETAGTTLSPTSKITGATGATLRNFTITGTVDLETIQEAVVENNIFVISTSASVGLKMDTTPANNTSPPQGTIFIRYNTFYGDSPGTGIESTLPRGQSAIDVHHNIFFGLGTSVNVKTGATLDAPSMTSNLFFHNTKDPTLSANQNNQVADPLFISTNPLDLHVHKDGPACQVGAYTTNSPHADWTPFPLPVTSVDRRSGAVVVSWPKDEACRAGTLNYRVYASDAPTGDFAQVGGPTGGTSLSIPVENLGPGPEGLTPPPTPGGLAASPRDRSLLLSWNESADADAYRVFWQTEGADERSADVGKTLEYKIDGLRNGLTYQVRVSAYKADVRYFKVSAKSSKNGLESRLDASEREASVGPAPGAESEKSQPITAVPEEIMGFPNLDNKSGCFLQTLSEDRACGTSSSGPALAALGLAAVVAAGMRWRRLLLGAALALVLLAPSARAEQPHLILGIMGGAIRPTQENWEANYDHKWVPTGKLNLGWRFLPWVEVGLEGGYWRAKGEAEVDGGEPAEMTLTVIPVQAYGIINLQFAEKQWIVPYGGGGYSRFYYRRTIEDQDSVKGHLSGHHWRGGIKFLLNGLDPDNARRAHAYFDLKRTFFAVEAQWAKVKDEDRDTDLGGRSYYGGLVLEF